MSTFHLPDLGEGLSEAEVLRWHVSIGEHVSADQPLVSVETAKAVVEVPSPRSGVIVALRAVAGERLETGAPLVDFAAAHGAAEPDRGTVVGQMPAGDIHYEHPAAAPLGSALAPRIQALPAVRALARGLGVELAGLQGSGSNGAITLQDVIAAGLPAAAGAGPAASAAAAAAATDGATTGELQQLRSVRRAMAHSMTRARDAVMACTVQDDADLHAWQGGDDYSARVLRAIAVACAAEPGLNAWYDGESQSRRLFTTVDVGLAVDTPDGLLVPVIRDVGARSAPQLRTELERLKAGAVARSLRSEELRDCTFMLSNFGMLAGRYATPVVVPPTVAILGTGRARPDVVALAGRIEVHRRLPLSLTFDHRVVTGGEAVRFLGALIGDLERAQ